MNQLINNKSLTMSSREIADLLKSRHDSVKRTIERLTKDGVITFTPSVVTNMQNKDVVVYDINKRNSYIVVAQISPEFTAILVDRWQELETSKQPLLPQTMAQALQLAADQAFQLEAQAPKVAFVDKYVHADSGNKTFRQVCKLLNVKENVFRTFLVDEKIMYRLNGEWAAHANHITAGRFATKTGVSDNDHAFNTAYFTPKGVEWVAAQFAKFKLNEAK